MATLKDWKEVRVGDIVSFKDEQTLLEAMEEGDAVLSVDLEVDSIQTLNAEDFGFAWTLMKFKDNNRVLIIKQIGDDYELIVGVSHEDMNVGNREDWINADQHFIFRAPEDLDNIIPSKLDFVDTIIDDEDIEFETLYEVWGDVGDDIGGIHEWAAKEPTSNPYAVIFEYGSIEEDEGGYLQFFVGVQVTDNDVRPNLIGG